MSAAHAISWSPADRGQAVIDGHSPVHFIVGFAAGIFGIDPHLAMMTFVGAKIVDESLRAGPKHALLGRERGQSLGNELADILFEVGGLYYGKMLRTKLTEPPPAQPPPAVQGTPHLYEGNLAYVQSMPHNYDYYDPRTHPRFL